MLLVAYGILPVTEIRKLGWRSNHAPKDLVTVLRRTVARAARPDRELPARRGRDVRRGRPCGRWCERGSCRGRTSPSYTIAMLAATRYRRATELVADDPALLEVEAWRLFEVEGGGEDSLANHEKFFGDTWGTVFRDLAAA